jgi:hypothetical protein
MCVSCNEHFNSMYAYSKHRIAFRCRPIEEMRALGMAQTKSGAWVASRNAFKHVTARANSGDCAKVIPR